MSVNQLWTKQVICKELEMSEVTETIGDRILHLLRTGGRAERGVRGWVAVDPDFPSYCLYDTAPIKVIGAVFFIASGLRSTRSPPLWQPSRAHSYQPGPSTPTPPAFRLGHHAPPRSA